MEKHCQIDFRENSFIVRGIGVDSITIDMSGDIDVTSLVEKLIQLIDTEDSIVLDTQEDNSWDDKKKMIYKLLSMIFEKYNACLAENNEEVKSVYSEQERNTVSYDYLSTTNDADDLPF